MFPMSNPFDACFQANVKGFWWNLHLSDGTLGAGQGYKSPLQGGAGQGYKSPLQGGAGQGTHVRACSGRSPQTGRHQGNKRKGERKIGSRSADQEVSQQYGNLTGAAGRKGVRQQADCL